MNQITMRSFISILRVVALHLHLWTLRKYDKKFKVEAIRLLKESGKTIKEVAENLGIYHGNLSK